MNKYHNNLVKKFGAEVTNFDIIPSVIDNEITGNKVCFIGWKCNLKYKGKTSQHGRYWPCTKDYHRDGLDKEIITLIAEDFAFAMCPILK